MAHGWADSTRNINVVRDALRATLDRMLGKNDGALHKGA